MLTEQDLKDIKRVAYLATAEVFIKAFEDRRIKISLRNYIKIKIRLLLFKYLHLSTK